ncbi:unnamed protein product [Allacma fusca]|uniref:Uncharacterized protein n=1 Tax=Allacma fusca TaxID=39272 RepID=A0A8J2NQ42_9HEXA|nr:unnamed protein product [Allacma fusca]
MSRSVESRWSEVTPVLVVDHMSTYPSEEYDDQPEEPTNLQVAPEQVQNTSESVLTRKERRKKKRQDKRQTEAGKQEQKSRRRNQRYKKNMLIVHAMNQKKN